VTQNGHVVVSTDNGAARGLPGPSKVFEFDPSGRRVHDITIGGQPEDHANGLGAATIDPHDGSLLVVDRSNHRVLRVQLSSGDQSVATNLPDVKPCGAALVDPPCEPGFIDHPAEPTALAIAPSGALYIADAGQATIWQWRPGASPPVPWYQSIDLATGDGPSGLALAGDAVFVSAARTLDPSSRLAGGLYRIAVNADGSAGARTLVAAFSSDERPGSIAAGSGGVIYVILRGTDTIAMVDADGVSKVPTSESPVPLDAPSAVVVHDGDLLVTNQSRSNTPANWVVLRFPLAG
jgi:sugar lactone lactonase YvrE